MAKPLEMTPKGYMDLLLHLLLRIAIEQTAMKKLFMDEYVSRSGKTKKQIDQAFEKKIKEADKELSARIQNMLNLNDIGDIDSLIKSALK